MSLADFSDFKDKPTTVLDSRTNAAALKSDKDIGVDFEQIDKYPESFDNWPEFKNVADSIGVDRQRRPR